MGGGNSNIQYNLEKIIAFKIVVKGEKRMRKEEIKQVIRDYVNDDKATYAVLINGVWGCGKTYLYENVLKDEIVNLESGRAHGKANVHISLYGISTVEQLSKEIVSNYILESKLRGNDDKKKIYGPISKATGIFSKMFSFSFDGVSVDFDKGIEEIKNNIQFKDMVICFDDLERCSIPINDLFGIINNLVEHCNCKVIILADEDNIGKVYANTNIEMKYKTLLQGRRVVGNKAQSREQTSAEDNKIEEIGIEELKVLNEKVYSENYIYKDIKEKVIGLSLKYNPDLEEEFDSIIKNTVSNELFSNMLVERKEKILEYMEKCNNNNIRIMRVWLNNFERIFKIIYKYYSEEKFFDEIFERFSIYSIRVACAIGKNKKLAEWENGIEVGYINLDDCFVLSRQGYRFVDDLYRDCIFDEKRICQAAKTVLNEKKQEEKLEIESQKGKTYKKLCQWYYLEDNVINENLPFLIDEIKKGEYVPQIYQKIISLLITLKEEGYCKDNFLKKVCNAMKCTIKNAKEKVDVENFQHHFEDEKEILELYHKYYDPVYSTIVKKNIEIDKREIEQVVDYSNGESFLNYCRNNYNIFPEKKSFISYIDVKALKNMICTGTIEDIYNITAGFNKVYYFSNIYDFFAEDAEQLRILKCDLESMECTGHTRKKAVQKLIDTLNYKIEQIENK